MTTQLLGYQAGDSWVHRLTGSTKLVGFLALTIAAMLSFDVRYLFGLAVLTIIVLVSTHVKWQQIAVFVYAVLLFAGLNLLLIYVFAPQYGVSLFGSQHVILGSGDYALTQEQLLYESIVALKYMVSLPMALLFLLTTNPSEFAAGLNKIGISYRVAYAFALTLRYIPDVQNEYQMISYAQQARGFDVGKSAPIKQRITNAVRVVMPLVLSSFARIDEISRAMALRRFGLKKRRTWYYDQQFKRLDWAVLIGIIGIVSVALILVIYTGSRYYNPLQ
ncbi:energy-coupling factor transporter transmembrane protein EcfT [Weissella diestrammenae]|uniref:Energy-coupling factor transporter transmembrane protein EcfT n=1 Tax=Weissella diestrammenae TaxID=1162633 RepID=A0A7G9T6Z6_9LACO|nr:energy-coupling factor transporter transmembrane component T [Weissella diestrammenae]MCM0582532.1 energy-coupling factor transporter transmembrane protein EcfT [Weissella diestrammenae]QNN75871.1 energy-coupling factor transporter transmembrane protein EcfT [Weissella diestrammenae]